MVSPGHVVALIPLPLILPMQSLLWTFAGAAVFYYFLLVWALCAIAKISDERVAKLQHEKQIPEVR
jgi:hypothetical protein